MRTNTRYCLFVLAPSGLCLQEQDKITLEKLLREAVKRATYESTDGKMKN